MIGNGETYSGSKVIDFSGPAQPKLGGLAAYKLKRSPEGTTRQGFGTLLLQYSNYFYKIHN
jgi:hypothetical protein